jgi:serine/threonine protein kinase
MRRDVKSSIILLDGLGHGKVVDVGLARYLHNVGMGIHAPAGTFVSLVHWACFPAVMPLLLRR